MNRRNFLSFAGGLVALSIVPLDLSAEDFRKSKPTVWTAHTIDDATKAMYGMKEIIETDKIKIKVPKINSSGAKVPVTFETSIDAKTIALFQDANPESLVAVFTVPANGIIDYKLRIKLAKTGTVTVVVQDGETLFSASKMVKVTAGGCGG